MAKLPPFTPEVADPGSAWEAVRARVAEGKRLDPVDGGFEPPWFEIGTVRGLASFAAAVLLALAAAVAVFFTRGPWFLGLLGGAAAAAALTWIFTSREAARIRRVRREGRVVPGAWASAEDSVAGGTATPANGWALFVVDVSEEPDAARAASAALELQRLRDEEPSSPETVLLRSVHAYRRVPCRAATGSTPRRCSSTSTTCRGGVSARSSSR